MTKRIGVSALAIAMTMGGAAFADQHGGEQGQNMQQGSEQQMQNQDVKVLSEWNYDDLYQGGLRAETLLDADVYGPNNEEIGSVENVILDRDNQIVAIIAQVGGFWDIGDTHISVPWDKVQMTAGGFQIPVTEDNVSEYGLYADPSIVSKSNLQSTRVVDDDLIAGRKTWKLTGLVDDYAVLNDGAGYGYIDDAIFNEQGKLQAIVVQPDYAGYGVGGRFAYPFYGTGYGWSPDAEAYDLRYDAEDLADSDPFEYERMQGQAQTAMEQEPGEGGQSQTD